MTPEEAYSRATGRCARAECCRHDLLQKFLRGGLTTQEAEKVLERLEAEHYVDDHRYARAYAHDKLHYDAWGKQKIRQGLLTKRIPEPVIREAIDQIDEQTYHAILEQAIRKKWASTTAESDCKRRQKVIRHALSRGYEPSVVCTILRKLTQATCEEECDEYTFSPC